MKPVWRVAVVQVLLPLVIGVTAGGLLREFYPSGPMKDASGGAGGLVRSEQAGGSATGVIPPRGLPDTNSGGPSTDVATSRSLSEHNQNLSRLTALFLEKSGSREMADRLSTLALSYRLLGMPTPDAVRVNQVEAGLRSDAMASFRAIATTLPAFPGDLEEERRYLVQFASQLDVDRASKLEFLYRELKRPVIGSDLSESVYTSMVALEVLVSLETDPKRLQRQLNHVLTAHRDNSAYVRLLLSRYAVKAPDAATDN